MNNDPVAKHRSSSPYQQSKDDQRLSPTQRHSDDDDDDDNVNAIASSSKPSQAFKLIKIPTYIQDQDDQDNKLDDRQEMNHVEPVSGVLEGGGETYEFDHRGPMILDHDGQLRIVQDWKDRPVKEKERIVRTLIENQNV